MDLGIGVGYKRAAPTELDLINGIIQNHKRQRLVLHTRYRVPYISSLRDFSAGELCWLPIFHPYGINATLKVLHTRYRVPYIASLRDFSAGELCWLPIFHPYGINSTLKLINEIRRMKASITCNIGKQYHEVY